MNIPKRASRHHAIRASFCAAVSTAALCAARAVVAVVVRSSARASERKRTKDSWARVKASVAPRKQFPTARTKLHGGEATVDRQCDAGDERCFVRHEPERRVGTFLSGAQPADRLSRLVRAQSFFWVGARGGELVQHRRVDD